MVCYSKYMSTTNLKRQEVISILRERMPTVQVSVEDRIKFKKDYQVYVFTIGSSQYESLVGNVRTTDNVEGIITKLQSALFL